jgi:tRNA pseudouridine65 synthase
MRETLPVLYRDDCLVAVHKPSGLLVHRSMIDRRETRFALQIVRDQIGQRVYPVHRLDKGTSGVLLFALDPASARRLGASFDAGEVDKRYLAVVRGWLPERGEIDHPLTRQDDVYGDPARRSGVGRENLQADLASAAPEPVAQSALTRYQRLACAEIAERVEPGQTFPTTRYSLVALNPVTGRQHQLRRHLKHIAHPIIGDATHGKGVHNRFIAARFGVGRLLLACQAMTLPHPEDARPISIEAALPEDFQKVLAGFGWS